MKELSLASTRGNAPALLSLYALGLNDFDPSKSNLSLERFAMTDFDLHLDVEFKNGKKFIDYCRKVTSNLKVERLKLLNYQLLIFLKMFIQELVKV